MMTKKLIANTMGLLLTIPEKIKLVENSSDSANLYQKVQELELSLQQANLKIQELEGQLQYAK